MHDKWPIIGLVIKVRDALHGKGECEVGKLGKSEVGRGEVGRGQLGISGIGIGELELGEMR
jgi:hypothetical protein